MGPMLLAGMTPADLDLPDKFKEFRRTQVEGVEFVLGSGGGRDKRFDALAQPAGSGKSLSAMTIGKMSGCKFAIVTVTRALESQYLRDFESSGLVNIRGRANYRCCDPELDAAARKAGGGNCGGLNCEEGFERGCKYADTTRCTYREQAERATDADAIVTNDQYWINVRGRNAHGLEREDNPIRLLIIDEAHLASSGVARHLSAWLSHKTAHEYAELPFRRLIERAKGEMSGRVDAQWVEVLRTILTAVAGEMAQLAFDYGNAGAAFRQSRKYRALKKVSEDVEKIVVYGGDGNWLWLQTQNFARQTGVRFECVWPGRYMERYMWSGAPKVVLLSATLRPKALEICGLTEGKYAYKEWPRQFPAENNPVVWVPTGPMGIKATSDELRAAIVRADQIYDEWAPHAKGIVHTASYKRAEWLATNSRWGKSMMINKPGEAADTADRFREAAPPAILVSPSYGTGWDFPDSECEWMHIIKLPFADRSDPVVRARADQDHEWYSYEAMQVLVQSCGRGTRHKEDKCTVIVTDDAVRNFRRYAARFAPGWFAVREVGEIPKYRGPRQAIG